MQSNRIQLLKLSSFDIAPVTFLKEPMAHDADDPGESQRFRRKDFSKN
jgi:hypothetical protein